MTRINGLTIVVGLICATCVWFTVSRADDESVAPVPTDPVAALVSRIEKLEKRIAVLEGREQATRQASAIDIPPSARELQPDNLKGMKPQDIKELMNRKAAEAKAKRNQDSLWAPQTLDQSLKPVEPARPKVKFFLLQH